MKTRVSRELQLKLEPVLVLGQNSFFPSHEKESHNAVYMDFWMLLTHVTCENNPEKDQLSRFIRTTVRLLVFEISHQFWASWTGPGSAGRFVVVLR